MIKVWILFLSIYNVGISDTRQTYMIENLASLQECNRVAAAYQVDRYETKKFQCIEVTKK